jgi:hypothetical protein
MEPVPAGWVDNVPRRESFEARHPDITITSDRWGNRWQASRDGAEIARATDLGRLLNTLEVLTGEREARQGYQNDRKPGQLTAGPASLNGDPGSAGRAA